MDFAILLFSLGGASLLPVAPRSCVSLKAIHSPSKPLTIIKKESDPNQNSIKWKGKQAANHCSSRSELFSTLFLHFDEEYTETIESFAPAAKTDL